MQFFSVVLASITFLCFSWTSQAAELHLSGGETATIQANVSTYVTCSGQGGGGNCSIIVEGFAAQLKACYNTYSGGYCSNKYWPDFKANNPKCYYGAIGVCLEYCEKTYSGGYCADKCN